MRLFVRVALLSSLIWGCIQLLGDELPLEASAVGSSGEAKMMLLGMGLALGVAVLWSIAGSLLRRFLEATRLENSVPMVMDLEQEESQTNQPLLPHGAQLGWSLTAESNPHPAQMMTREHEWREAY